MRPTILSSKLPMVPTLRKVAIARRSRWPASDVNFGRDDGELHRLFLEQRHAQVGPAPARSSSGPCGGAGEGYSTFSSAIAPAQIGMDHVALDRARAARSRPR
jgi:hypothetical protein